MLQNVLHCCKFCCDGVQNLFWKMTKLKVWTPTFTELFTTKKFVTLAIGRIPIFRVKIFRLKLPPVSPVVTW
jgi:hypothetical protein